MIVVHIGGYVAPSVLDLVAICDAAGVPLVEDAAHAHGASLDGASAGSFGVAGTFSFYPTKVMAGGEGGMIVSADERIADEARIYRDQGKASFLTNLHTRLGSNWRMSEPHAAIALTQLRRLDEFIAKRQTIAAVYDAAMAAIGLTPVTISPRAVTNRYKYIARLPTGVDRVGPQEAAARGVGRGAVRRGLRGAAAPPAGVRAVVAPSRCPAPTRRAPDTSACRCRR